MNCYAFQLCWWWWQKHSFKGGKSRMGTKGLACLLLLLSRVTLAFLLSVLWFLANSKSCNPWKKIKPRFCFLIKHSVPKYIFQIRPHLLKYPIMVQKSMFNFRNFFCGNSYGIFLDLMYHENVWVFNVRNKPNYFKTLWELMRRRDAQIYRDLYWALNLIISL